MRDGKSTRYKKGVIISQKQQSAVINRATSTRRDETRRYEAHAKQHFPTMMRLKYNVPILAIVFFYVTFGFKVLDINYGRVAVRVPEENNICWNNKEATISRLNKNDHQPERLHEYYTNYIDETTFHVDKDIKLKQFWIPPLYFLTENGEKKFITTDFKAAVELIKQINPNKQNVGEKYVDATKRHHHRVADGSVLVSGTKTFGIRFSVDLKGNSTYILRITLRTNQIDEKTFVPVPDQKYAFSAFYKGCSDQKFMIGDKIDDGKSLANPIRIDFIRSFHGVNRLYHDRKLSIGMVQSMIFHKV